MDKIFTRIFKLKYGINPHQNDAFVWAKHGYDLPFKVLNGNPGYINLLDALNAWQLVCELRTCLGLSAAASFKHISPAGAAIAVPLDSTLSEIYEVNERKLSDSAIAYIRARNGDPKSSFGDFSALSDHVDKETALFLKGCFSDGIIAPSYDSEAIDILSKKKKACNEYGICMALNNIRFFHH